MSISSLWLLVLRLTIIHSESLIGGRWLVYRGGWSRIETVSVRIDVLVCRPTRCEVVSKARVARGRYLGVGYQVANGLHDQIDGN